MEKPLHRPSFEENSQLQQFTYKIFVTSLALIPTDALLNIALFGLYNPQGFVSGPDLPSYWAQPSTGLLIPERIPNM